MYVCETNELQMGPSDDICVKVCSTHDEVVKAACQNEFDILSKLDHPYVIKVHKLFMDQ